MKCMEKLPKQKNDDYITGNLFDYLYHQKYCKLNGEDLLRQANTSIPRQKNFIAMLQEYIDGTMFFIAERQ